MCTTQSRGFVFILRSLAPSARAVASKVEHHRKPMAMLSLPSAIYAPEIERMWSVQAAVQISQRREVGRSSQSSSLSAQFSLSNSSLAVTSRGVSRFCELSNSFARRSAFFEELAVSSQKLRGSGRNLPAFLPKVRRCFPSLCLFSAQRVAVCKKIPRCLPDSGGMSFVARTAGRVARSGFSTWRRRGAIA